MRHGGMHRRMQGLRVGMLLLVGFTSGAFFAPSAYGAPRNCIAGCRARSSGAQMATRAGQQGGAWITLDTDSATVGTWVGVSGGGFPANTLVEVGVSAITGITPVGTEHTVSEPAINTVTTAEDGSFASAPAPIFISTEGCGSIDLAPKVGSLARFEARTQDGAVSASRGLRLVAMPMLALGASADEYLSPGAATVRVYGRNWIPGVVVTCVLGHYPTDVHGAAQSPFPFNPGNARGGAPVPLDGAKSVQVVSQADGSFVADVPIMATLRAGTDLLALAIPATSRYGTFVAVLYAGKTAPVNPFWPSIALDHNRGPLGGAIVATGERWPPGVARLPTDRRNPDLHPVYADSREL